MGLKGITGMHETDENTEGEYRGCRHIHEISKELYFTACRNNGNHAATAANKTTCNKQ